MSRRRKEKYKDHIPAVLVHIFRCCGVQSAQTPLLRVAHKRDRDVLEDGPECLAVGFLELVLLQCVDRTRVSSRRPDAITVGNNDTLD
jgi:hypothetical protein